MSNISSRYDSKDKNNNVTSTPDDASVDTLLAGIENKKSDHEMKEITLKFEFQPSNDDEAKQIAVVHTHIMIAIQSAFDKDIIIFDNHNNQLPTVEAVKWHSPLIHQRHFAINTSTSGKGRRPKYSIIHRIHTTQSLSTIRNCNPIFKLLRDNNCYMRKHAWEETKWSTTQYGYCIGINPQHYDEEQASKIVIEHAKSKGITNLPSFRMIYSSPRINYCDRKTSSKAYAIETESKNKGTMMRCLKDMYRGTNLFLAAKLRYDAPNSFANAIRMQNNYLQSTYVIPLANVTVDILFYIQDQIKSIEGVQDIVTTRKSKSHGRYHILVEKERFKPIQKILHENWNKLIEKIPSDATSDFESPPTLSTRTDDESTGDKSFLSMSAASFASVNTDCVPDAFEMYTSITSPYSWSEMANPDIDKNHKLQGNHDETTEDTGVSDLTSQPPSNELALVRAQLEQMQAKTDAQSKIDQETISQLRLSLSRTESILSTLTKALDRLSMQPPKQDSSKRSNARTSNDSTSNHDHPTKKTDIKLTPTKLFLEDEKMSVSKEPPDNSELSTTPPATDFQ